MATTSTSQTTVIFNDVFEYQPHLNNQRNPTTCHLLVLQQSQQETMQAGEERVVSGTLVHNDTKTPLVINKQPLTLVIATELHDNHGMSITNSSEAMATEVVRRFSLNPEHCRFFEHYSDEVSYGFKGVSDFNPDRFANVAYTWKQQHEATLLREIDASEQFSMYNRVYVASHREFIHMSFEKMLKLLGVPLTSPALGFLSTSVEFIAVLDPSEDDSKTAFKIRWEMLPETMPVEVYEKDTKINYERVQFIYGIARDVKKNVVEATLATKTIKNVRFYAVSREFKVSL